MKTEKLVEQRIEKHLELVDEPQKSDVQIIDNVDSVPVVINGDETKDNDFQYARENLYDIIEKGRDAMEELLEIAKAEESPRAFEVFGQLLKNMTDSQETLKIKVNNLEELTEVGKERDKRKWLIYLILPICGCMQLSYFHHFGFFYLIIE